mgnify:CR=1 FL=1|jgi:hypothetical protein
MPPGKDEQALSIEASKVERRVARRPRWRKFIGFGRERSNSHRLAPLRAERHTQRYSEREYFWKSHTSKASMHSNRWIIVTCAIIASFLGACNDQSRQPASVPPPGSDTLFELPPYLVASNVRTYRADLNSDGWQDVIVLVQRSSPASGEGSDTLFFYTFDRTIARHRLVASYSDFGISDVAIAHYPTISSAAIIVSLYGGGNDATSYGKAILTLHDSTLQTLAYAPWGNPSIVELDSTVLLVIHESYSGSLPHADAVEYADSLITVGMQNNAMPYEQRIAAYTTYIRTQLDSIATHQREIGKQDWYTVTSLIMSLANLESKQKGAVAARAVIERELRRWRQMPGHYRTLLREFSETGSDEFSFIR